MGLASKYESLQHVGRVHTLLLESGQRVIIASHNPGKVGEMRAILAPLKLKVIAAAEMQLAEPLEDGDTFAANAEIKATSACSSTGLTAIADDLKTAQALANNACSKICFEGAFWRTDIGHRVAEIKEIKGDGSLCEM